MVLYILLFFAGLLLLYLGAEGLVQGASSLALQYGIRPVVVGLTVVALGTSMPEFLVNFFAIFTNESQLALGNIIGSNISNVALILGTSALVLPLTVTPQIFRREYPVMFGVMVLFYISALDGVIATVDGLIMVTLLVGLGGYLLYDVRRTSTETILAEIEGGLQAADPEMTDLQKVFYVLGGIGGLALGAHLMVENAVSIAELMGIDHVVIGLTAVAIGTSLPELAASMVSAVKEEADMSVGNILGSNVLNVLFVVGTLSMVEPIPVETHTLNLHFPVMLAFCALLLPFAWTGQQISRAEGGFLLASFLGYMTYLALPYV